MTGSSDATTTDEAPDDRGPDESTRLESLADPTTLRDRDDVEYVEETRTVGEEKFEGLRKRYERIDGVVMVGLVDDGRVLLEGQDEWYPPGGSVQAGDDWVATARRSIEALTGIDVAIESAASIERTYFCLEGDEDERFPTLSVNFRARPVDAPESFLSDPTLAEDFEHPFADEDEVRLGWFASVPEDANPNHVDHIRLFTDPEGER